MVQPYELRVVGAPLGRQRVPLLPEQASKKLAEASRKEAEAECGV